MRYLHTMVRVKDLEASLHFYCNLFGLTEIRRYVAVYNAVKDAYVEPVDDQTLMKAALRGLLSDLDPHSAYLEKDAAEERWLILAEMVEGLAG